ncbi:oxidoreductase [Streptomyces sp. NPDC006923]|uniref:oxidoreductase n=1 Tax=Streptomyces sp. NPDC006923 TaxID=3155355 RepID=UPI0033E74EFC
MQVVREEYVSVSAWTFSDIPDQTGRTVVVTGANTGIGREAATMFARKGAHVVLACRDPRKGDDAVKRIRALRPSGSVRADLLDLADLDSVGAFAEAFRAGHDRLDVLINNAGVMWSPLSRTKQGFELQFGTNHLGHFALTGQLLPLLLRTPGARVTTMSSLAQKFGRIDFDDLDWRRRSYSSGAAYNQSKLANMMFVLELQRRLEASGSAMVVTAAHPGWTSSELTRHSHSVIRRVSPVVGLKPEIGTLGLMRAATDPTASSGSYWGPGRFFETRGYPSSARISRRAEDITVAARLWEESSVLTGVAYAFVGRTERATDV